LAAARTGGAIGVFYWEPTWIATTEMVGTHEFCLGDQWGQSSFVWLGWWCNPAIALFKP